MCDIFQWCYRVLALVGGCGSGDGVVANERSVLARWLTSTSTDSSHSTHGRLRMSAFKVVTHSHSYR